MANDKKKEQTATPAPASSGGRRADASSVNLQKARAYKEPTQSQYLGSAQRNSELYTGAIKGTSAQKYWDDVRSSGGSSGQNTTSAQPKKKNRLQEINNYLNSGETTHEKTSSYLEEANGMDTSGMTEREQTEWYNLKKALEEQDRNDLKREKRERNPLLRAFNSVVEKGKNADPNAGFITDPVTQANVDREKPKTPEQIEAEEKQANDAKELQGLYDAWQEAVRFGDRDAEELGQKYQTRKAELQGQTEPQLTESQKAYQELAAEDDMYSGYATDPLTAMQMQGRSDERQAAKEAVKEENRENGNPLYEGLAENDRISDATQSWLGGRLAGDAASVGAILGGLDANVGYIDDVHRDLVTRQRDAAYAGNYAEAERLQEEVDRYEQEHLGDNRTVLGDVSDALLSGAQDLQNTSEQQWQDVTEDMSDAGRTVANVARTGSDVALDIVENAIVPGAGTMRMYLGAGGSTALDQMGRENNDPNSVLVASVKGAATAYFSNKLLGGMEAAYGKSILGDITGRMVENAHPAVQTAVKTLLNTEGAEEGLEDILNYAADKILGLDPEAQLSWDEVKQDAFIGYVLGVLTNGLSAGINYDGAKRRALADEALAFAESGMTLEEAEQVARESTREDVVMKPSAEPEAEVQETMDLGPEVQQSTPDVPNVAEPNRARPGEVITAEPAAEPQAASTPQAPQAAGGPTANREAYQGPRMPEASYGGGTTVKVGKSRIPVHYAVIPVSRLTASHDIYGNVNRNYPGELQPRDRTRGTSQAQALQIGQDLDPEQLEWSPTATGGAPIVRSDGVVISGNGRTLGINYAIQTGRAHDYTQYLRENASRFGIDPQSIREDSVLVRVADGDYDWQQMAEEANVSTVSQMSTTEQAGVDAERLSRYPEILSLLAPNETGDLNTSDNKEFVRQFLQAVVPESEQGNVWTENNGLSQSGLARIKNAVFQVAYGDASLMARLSESLDNNMKNVSNSLLAAAPKVAALENGVQNGTRYIGVRDQILAGVKLFEQAKSQGVEVSKIADQISADGNVGADAVFIAEFLQENFRSQKQIRSFLNAMADTAESYGDPTQIGFFDTVETAPTDREVLEGAIRKYEQETGKQPGELGSPDYDFYGERSGIFDFATNRQSQRGNQTQTDTANDRAAESTGENAGREPDVIDNLLGNEPKATETAQNEPEAQEGVDSNPETENAPEGELNAQEPQEEQNQEGQNNQDQKTGQDQEEQKQDTGKKQSNRNKRRENYTEADESTDEAFERLNRAYGSIEKGENPARDIDVAKKDSTGRKVGEGARTIFEAKATPEERLGDLKAAVVNGNFGHVTVTNDSRSKSAAGKIAKDGWKKSVGDFLGAVDAGKSDADTIALGAHLLNEAGNSPEASGRDYVELAMAYNEAMTRAGQGLAAGRILKTLTPEGKLYGFEKTVEKINKEIRQKNEKRKPGRQKAEVKLNEELVEKFLTAKTDEERNAVQDEMVKDVAKQVPNTIRDKFTALRYLNMLGNFKTQVRNVAGNTAMTTVQKIKNTARSGIEGIVAKASGGKYERNYKSGYGTDRLKAASADFVSDEDLKSLALGEKKWSDVGRQAEAEIQDAKDPFSTKWFGGKALNLYSKITNKAMELGDLIFVRANYADALAGYMNAHNISAADWKAMVADPSRSAEVDKARNFAIKQAQEATFRDTNTVSKFMSTFDSKWADTKGGKVARAITQGVVPFRKTPANVLVRMEEYSPLGTINTVVKGIQAAKGTAEVSEVIDSAAKTMTGTGLTVLGALLASMGAARTKDDDDKEQALAKLKGQQDYSIEIGGKSFTMDWLSPMSAPFFMGVEAYNMYKDGGITAADLFNVTMSITNPMLEMSMLSGINDALDNLSDFEGDNSAVAQFVLNSAWSYLTQGVSNTLLGQMEQFSEDYRQTYYTDPDNPLLTSSMQKKIAKLGNKTPGKDYQAADYIDAWGRKQENDQNLLTRAWNTFINPSYVSDMDQKATEANDVIETLLQFGQSQTTRDDFPNVVPKTPSRSTTVNGTRLTPEEYEVYATTKGQAQLDAVTEFANSDLFNEMGYFSAAETVSDIYSYASFLAASRVAEMRGEDYYDDTFSPLVTGRTKDGESTFKDPIREEDVPEYLAYKAAYDSALKDKDYDAVDILLGNISDLPASARTGAEQHADKMGTLADLRKAGMSSSAVYYQFQDGMKSIYEGEKRTAPKSSDYIREAGSGKYSEKDADAIMNYETTVSEKSTARYKDQVRYNLEQAGMGGSYREVWNMVQSVADGDMTKDEFKSWVNRNVPVQYQQAIKDVSSNYSEDRHVAGKQVSGIYRAARAAGSSPEEALEFYNMIDTNYNGYYTKKELDAAVRNMYGNSATARQVRAMLKESIGK